jgi:hypothetical protein
MIVKELFGTQFINASFLFANSNISVKHYSKDFPSVSNTARKNEHLLAFNNYLAHIDSFYIIFQAQICLLPNGKLVRTVAIALLISNACPIDVAVIRL